MIIADSNAALATLASTADLSIRGIDITDSALTEALLQVASAAIRNAAGSPILEATSTVTLWATDEGSYLSLPGQPVSLVSSVTRSGVAVTDHRLVDGKLWRSSGWGNGWGEPIEFTVTLTHGLLEVPADIVDLTCSLVGAGLAACLDGEFRDPRKVAEMVGDYQVTWARGADTVATAMGLPAPTRRWLKRRFGGGVGMVRYQ